MKMEGALVREEGETEHARVRCEMDERRRAGRGEEWGGKRTKICGSESDGTKTKSTEDRWRRGR